MSSHLAHQFDDAEQQRQAATLGMWAFLTTEVLFFGGMIAGYTIYRFRYPHDWSVASRQLDIWWGAINTAVLLTSSLTMALSVDSAKAGNPRRLRKFLLLTMLLGTVFLCIKGYEYSHKFHENLVPGKNFVWTHEGSAFGPAQLFFSFYFVMTGCHAVHMIVGLGLLITLFIQSRRGRFSDSYFTPVENVGLYWHFVDIVWVFLYPLLYLIDRS
jgi:cytochrome c oxidase subunit 3